MSTDIITDSQKINFDSEIENFLETYSLTEAPIEISFRELVPDLNKVDRATHLIHTYPAKLLMHIPFFFLNNNIFSKKGDLVLDPFSGSGTVLLEASLAERKSIGADANPLARLISRVKTTMYDPELLRAYSKLLFDTIPQCTSAGTPMVCNVNYWFLPHVKNQLEKIIEAIKVIPNRIYRDFFWVCFSNCIKKVSLADPRVSVPVKLKLTQYSEGHPLYNETKKKLESFEKIDVFSKLKECIDQNINRFDNLKSLCSLKYPAKIVSDDARNLRTESIDGILNDSIEDNSVSLIISSPPYAGAQKYIRASSLNLGWLNLINTDQSLKQLEDLNIGREHYKKAIYKNFTETGLAEADELLKEIYKKNPLRAYIASNYLNEMHEALAEAVKLLKPGGYFILIAGNNQVCSKEFKTQEYLMKIVESLGLKVVLRLIDDIKSYGLMTKRNKTANVITREWVLVFQK